MNSINCATQMVAVITEGLRQFSSRRRRGTIDHATQIVSVVAGLCQFSMRRGDDGFELM